MKIKVFRGPVQIGWWTSEVQAVKWLVGEAMHFDLSLSELRSLEEGYRKTHIDQILNVLNVHNPGYSYRKEYPLPTPDHLWRRLHAQIAKKKEESEQGP